MIHEYGERDRHLAAIANAASLALNPGRRSLEDETLASWLACEARNYFQRRADASHLETMD